LLEKLTSVAQLVSYTAFAESFCLTDEDYLREGVVYRG
jgi:hypothetical protein